MVLGGEGQRRKNWDNCNSIRKRGKRGKEGKEERKEGKVKKVNMDKAINSAWIITLCKN